MGRRVLFVPFPFGQLLWTSCLPLFIYVILYYVFFPIALYINSPTIDVKKPLRKLQAFAQCQDNKY